jgi:hypothetical protein
MRMNTVTPICGNAVFGCSLMESSRDKEVFLGMMPLRGVGVSVKL